MLTLLPSIREKNMVLMPNLPLSSLAHALPTGTKTARIIGVRREGDPPGLPPPEAHLIYGSASADILPCLQSGLAQVVVHDTAHRSSRDRTHLGKKTRSQTPSLDAFVQGVAEDILLAEGVLRTDGTFLIFVQDETVCGDAQFKPNAVDLSWGMIQGQAQQIPAHLAVALQHRGLRPWRSVSLVRHNTTPCRGHTLGLDAAVVHLMWHSKAKKPYYDFLTDGVPVKSDTSGNVVRSFHQPKERHGGGTGPGHSNPWSRISDTRVVRMSDVQRLSVGYEIAASGGPSSVALDDLDSPLVWFGPNNTVKHIPGVGHLAASGGNWNIPCLMVLLRGTCSRYSCAGCGAPNRFKEGGWQPTCQCDCGLSRPWVVDTAACQSAVGAVALQEGFNYLGIDIDESKLSAAEQVLKQTILVDWGDAASPLWVSGSEMPSCKSPEDVMGWINDK